MASAPQEKYWLSLSASHMRGNPQYRNMQSVWVRQTTYVAARTHKALDFMFDHQQTTDAATRNKPKSKLLGFFEQAASGIIHSVVNNTTINNTIDHFAHRLNWNRKPLVGLVGAAVLTG